MKKYFNKALMYQWFNSAKIAILIGILAWGVLSMNLISGNVHTVQSRIAFGANNDFYTLSIEQYFFVGIIFIAIYFIGQGINKRNNDMFLYNGPYTNNVVKMNQFVCMIITLLLFALVYVYMIAIVYMRNVQLMSIVDGYINVMSIELMKFILIGIIGILFILITDLLFSNLAASILGMGFLLPASIYFIFIKFIYMMEYIDVQRGNGIMNFIYKNMTFLLSNPILRYVSIRKISFKYLLVEIIMILIIIAAMFTIFILMKRNYKIEKCTNIFTSKKAQNFVCILCSIALGMALETMLLYKFINAIVYRSNNGFLYGKELAFTLSIEILSITVITYLLFYFGKKIVRKALK